MPASADFQLQVNQMPVDVYQTRVSAVPANQVWPGHQRPLEETELASFAYFDFSGQVQVEIVAGKPVQSVIIRPQSYGIKPAITGNTIRFSLDKACQLAVEVNGWHHALHLFANPLEKERPGPEDKKVHYFAPGYHEVGKITLKDDETVYIAGGAVVHGVIEAIDARNIRVMGRGILDAGRIGRFDDVNMIHFLGCRDVLIDGIIFNDAHKWTLVTVKCERVQIDNVKLIGMWRYNSDGIDLVNSQRVVVENSFVRTFDDNIVLKGFPAWGGEKYDTQSRPLKDILVRNCVLWGDWGRPLEIGAETRTDSIYNVLFKDIEIIHFVQRAMDVQNGDRALVSKIRFENINIEHALIEGYQRQDIPNPDPSHPDHPQKAGMLLELFSDPNPYSKDSQRGRIKDVIYKNIQVIGDFRIHGRIAGLDEQHLVEDVTIENLVVRGRHILRPEDANIIINPYCRNIVFK